MADTSIPELTGVETLKTVNGVALMRGYDQDGWRWSFHPEDRDNPASWYASTTGILQPIVHHQLKRWMVDTPGEEQKKILEETGQRGTEIHKQVALDLQELESNPPPEWLELKEEHNIVAEATEVTVYSPTLGYAGTMDFVGRYDDTRGIVDVKSGYYSIKAGWQLAGYQGAHKELTGEALGMAVATLRPPPKLWKYEHIDWCWLEFLCCLHIWRGLYHSKLKRMGWQWLYTPILKPVDFIPQEEGG